jgi:putative transposase
VKPQILQIVFKKGKVTANLVHDVETTIKLPKGNALAIDLGIKNFVTTYDTGKATRIYKGGKILSTSYYSDKKIAALQSKLPKDKHRSKAISRLCRRKNAGIKQVLHCYANDIREYCISNDANTVVIGDLNGVREGVDGTAKNWGTEGNLKLHS